jgi:hypothetical protein
MKLRSVTLVCILLSFLCLRANAQGPRELATSVSRRWHTYSDTIGYRVALPDFFKKGNLARNRTSQYQPVDTNVTGIILFISLVGNGNSDLLKKRYEQLANALTRQEDTKVEYKHLTKTSFVVSSVKIDDDEHDKNGNEQRYFWYARGMVAGKNVYEISIRYQPEYQKMIKKIIPKIAASFKEIASTE